MSRCPLGAWAHLARRERCPGCGVGPQNCCSRVQSRRHHGGVAAAPRPLCSRASSRFIRRGGGGGLICVSPTTSNASASAVAVLRESALVPALCPPFPVGVLPSLSLCLSACSLLARRPSLILSVNSELETYGASTGSCPWLPFPLCCSAAVLVPLSLLCPGVFGGILMILP